MPGCVGQCTYYWDEGAGAWYPGGFNTCESGCTCGPPPGQEGPYDGYVATVACEGTPASTTTSSSSSSSSTTSSTTTSSSSTSPPTTTTSSSSSSSSSSSTTTSSTTSSTTTSTTTTSAPCDGLCTYSWLPVGAGYQWVLQFSTCTAPGCYCNPPGYSGSYHGQEGFGFCLDTQPTTTTTTTSTSTSTTSTAPPTTTTTTTGTTTTTTSSTSSTTTTTTTEQPCTGTCTWRWYAELQKWIKVSGGNGTCSTGCSCSYPESNGTTDGETVAPACKRLTCMKCCGNPECCMYKFDAYPCALCPNNKINKTIYATFESSDAWPCADGFSVPLTLFNVQSGPGNSFILPGISNPVTSPATYYLSEWRNRGPLSVTTNAGTFSRITPCNGNIYAYTINKCSGTPIYTQIWANIRYFSLNSGPQGLDRCVYYLYILFLTRRLPDSFTELDPYKHGDVIEFYGLSEGAPFGLNDPGRLKSFTYINNPEPCYEPWDMAFDFSGSLCIFGEGNIFSTYHDLSMQNDTGIVRITE